MHLHRTKNNKIDRLNILYNVIRKTREIEERGNQPHPLINQQSEQSKVQRSTMATPVLLVLLASLVLTVVHCEVYSAVKKSYGFKISEEVSDMVDIVQGYHPDALLYVNFTSTINKTG